MSNSKWNTISKLMLGSMSLVAAIYISHITQSVSHADTGTTVYNSSGTSFFSGLFLLISLLVLSNFISNRAFPSKENYLLVVFGGIFLVLYLLVGTVFL